MENIWDISKWGLLVVAAFLVERVFERWVFPLIGNRFATYREQRRNQSEKERDSFENSVQAVLDNPYRRTDYYFLVIESMIIAIFYFSGASLSLIIAFLLSSFQIGNDLLRNFVNFSIAFVVFAFFVGFVLTVLKTIRKGDVIKEFWKREAEIDEEE